MFTATEASSKPIPQKRHSTTVQHSGNRRDIKPAVRRKVFIRGPLNLPSVPQGTVKPCENIAVSRFGIGNRQVAASCQRTP